MAEKNERNFSSEQIRRNRDAVIGLQAGTNIGATQVPPVCHQTLILIYTLVQGRYGSHGEQQAHVKCEVVLISTTKENYSIANAL